LQNVLYIKSQNNSPEAVLFTLLHFMAVNKTTNLDTRKQGKKFGVDYPSYAEI